MYNHIDMANRIKLIWDFRGNDAQKIAEHHEIHLKEYIIMEKLALNITGVETITEIHSIAWMVVENSQMYTVRDALRPHRGEIY